MARSTAHLPISIRHDEAYQSGMKIHLRGDRQGQYLRPRNSNCRRNIKGYSTIAGRERRRMSVNVGERH